MTVGLTPVEVAPAESRRRGSDRSFPRWLTVRILTGLVILFVVSILIFASTQALPGNLARIILGVDATPQQLTQFRLKLGLDEPLTLQYFHWLGGVLTGHLGDSLVNGTPVSQLLGYRVLNSFTLVIFSMVISIPLSIVLGIWTAENRDGIADRILLRVSMVANAVPDFILGTILVVLFATTVLKVLPPVAIIPAGDLPWWYPSQLVLPVATLVIMATTYLYRLVRSSFIDVLDSEYVQMATLKGLTRWTVLIRHALPNAITPMIQASAITTASALGGVVVLESVFAYPGIGTLLTDSIGTHDLPVIQAIVLLIAAVFFVANLVADILTGVHDRRSS